MFLGSQLSTRREAERACGREKHVHSCKSLSKLVLDAAANGLRLAVELGDDLCRYCMAANGDAALHLRAAHACSEWTYVSTYSLMFVKMRTRTCGFDDMRRLFANPGRESRVHPTPRRKSCPCSARDYCRRKTRQMHAYWARNMCMCVHLAASTGARM